MTYKWRLMDGREKSSCLLLIYFILHTTPIRFNLNKSHKTVRYKRKKDIRIIWLTNKFYISLQERVSNINFSL